ncbi:MAG TPA: hypothetical protein VFJ06_08145 [Halococcus sp.]|nr:hypothetical protein [Halococcus sp.]
MSSCTTRVVTGLVVLLAVSFAIHYALFGSLPIGKPAALRDEEAN